MTRVMITAIVLVVGCDSSALPPAWVADTEVSAVTKTRNIPTPQPVLYQVRRGRVKLPPGSRTEEVEGAFKVVFPTDGFLGQAGGQLSYIMDQGQAVKQGDLLVAFSTQTLQHLADEAFVERQKADAALAQVESDYKYLTFHQEFILADLEWKRQMASVQVQSHEVEDTLNRLRGELTGETTLVETEIKIMDWAEESSFLASDLQKKKDQLADLQLRNNLLEHEVPLQKTRLDIEYARAMRAFEQGGRQAAAILATTKAQTEAAKYLAGKWKSRFEDLQQKLAMCKIQAQRDGIVTHSRRWQLGDVVYPGQEILLMTPSSANAVPQERPESLLVPNSAIDRDTGQPSCLVVTPDGIDCRLVTVSAAGEQMTEVQNGLTEGERVILKPKQWPWYVTRKAMLQQTTGTADDPSELVNRLEAPAIVIGAIPNGSLVKKGDVLVQLDASDRREALFRADIVVARSLAERQQARIEHELQKTGGETDLANARSRLDLARAEQQAFGNEGEPGVFQTRMKYFELRARDATEYAEQLSREYEKSEVAGQLGQADRQNTQAQLGISRAKLLRAQFRKAACLRDLREFQMYTARKEQLDLARRIEDAENAVADATCANESHLRTKQSKRKASELIHRTDCERLERLREQLGRTQVVSPCDGIVWLQEEVYVGATVAPNQLLGTVESAGETKTSEALVILPSAVCELNGTSFCHVWRQGNVEMQPVVLGRRTNRWLEVLEGLSPGEMVLRKPQ